jgi:hypothetical protein
MWSFPPRLLRLLRLALVVFAALSVMHLVNSTPPRARTWGYCWDPAFWAWWDSQLESSSAHNNENPRPTDRPGLWL